MKLTSDLFADFLKCPTKCYLHSTGQTGSGNTYADWVTEQNDAYRAEAAKRLMAGLPQPEVLDAPPASGNLKASTWRLALDLPIETETVASRLHAVECVSPKGRGRPAHFVPIRFVFLNKLTKDERFLLVFDALVLSEVFGQKVDVGTIIYGDDHAILKVKLASLLRTTRDQIGRATAMLAAGSTPDLILNRHCAECEFRDVCRQQALEQNDLSLLGGMTEKERERHRSRGIFTINQLSYTFPSKKNVEACEESRETPLSCTPSAGHS